VRPFDKPVKTVGIIGSTGSFQYPIDELRRELAGIGLELVYNEDFWQTYGVDPNREMRLKVCDFYKEIDIQVVWRPKYKISAEAPFKNPNKLENAGAFGIPTVSFPEPSFLREWNRAFIQVNSVRRLIKVCNRLKNDPKYYRWYARKALERAEAYHIDNIAKLYKRLK
jgi:sulfur relay (sulfurtransferase) DsrC/TusE family protein